MKLKLNTANLPPPSAEPTPTPSTARAAGKISLKLGKATPAATPTPTVAATPRTNKRVPKKRKTYDDEITVSTKKIKTAAKPTLIRLKSSKSQAGTPKTPIAHINIKAKGKIPTRPLGVGYDSEAEDAEEDPSIEENIILRMKAGPDCDLLRKAIDEKRLGAKPEENGVRVSMRFFGKDGRRASVSVGDHHYGAILVDLPTIIESMKSWDKRGWWKSADICQMLLVLDSINAPEDAKTMPLPRELDQKTWQWPHGLTPPMHNVRKRRFRKRVSYRTIEAAEQEVERLLEEDAIAQKMGGDVEHDIIDLDELREQEEMESEDEYEEGDATGDLDDSQMQMQEEYEDEEDDDAAAARLALELGEDDEDELAEQSAIDPSASTPMTPAASTKDRPNSNGLAPGQLQTTNSTSPAAGTTSGDNDDDDDDDEQDGDEDSGDEEDSDDELDDDAREEAQQKQQQMEDIAQLDLQLLQQRQNLANVTSAIFRTRIAAQIKTLEAERDVKRRAAGLEDDNIG